MFENRKIKKAIKKHRKPNISFEEFCEKHDINLDRDIEQSDVRVKSNAFSLGIRMMSACCLMAVILTVIFLSKTILPQQIKFYGSDMVNMEQISEEQFFNDGISVLIDFSKVEQIGVISQVKPKDGEDLLLGYTVTNILYGFKRDEELFAFELMITIRCYKGYLFIGNEYFKDLNYDYTDNCKYDLSANQEEAYIVVSGENRDYFIVVKEYEGITSVSKENIELLIQDIL